jgi:hypothetical protein
MFSYNPMFKYGFKYWGAKAAFCVLNFTNQLHQLYFYVFSHTIMNINVFYTSTDSLQTDEGLSDLVKNVKFKREEQMRVNKLYAFWYEYIPSFMGFKGLNKVLSNIKDNVINGRNDKTIFYEIVHTDANLVHTTLVSPRWLAECASYTRLIQELHDNEKDKSNTSVQNVLSVSIHNEIHNVDVTDVYSNIRHSLNLLKLTSYQFCSYVLLKNPPLTKFLRTSDQVTIMNEDFEETTFKNSQYIN